MLDQFTFSVNFLTYAADSYDIEYPGLILQIRLARKIGYHVLQTYLPSTLFVLLGEFILHSLFH